MYKLKLTFFYSVLTILIANFFFFVYNLIILIPQL